MYIFSCWNRPRVRIAYNHDSDMIESDMIHGLVEPTVVSSKDNMHVYKALSCAAIPMICEYLFNDAEIRAEQTTHNADRLVPTRCGEKFTTLFDYLH
jgi:hypothetical protein